MNIRKTFYNKLNLLWLFVGSLFLSNCNFQDQPSQPLEENVGDAPASIPYQLLHEYPHDTGAYTQGLVWYKGQLIEGTGQIGESNVRKVSLTSGTVEKQVNNSGDIFGEGITILGNKLYQITWRNRKGFVYDAQTLLLIREFPLKTDGWGLTSNGQELIYSDGTSNLYFLDTNNLMETKRIGVTDQFGPVGSINELEFINGFIYANRYLTDYILKINPSTGKVVGKVDLSDLKGKTGIVVKDPEGDVLNGIAYDSTAKRIFITGKYWPKLFEIKLDQ